MSDESEYLIEQAELAAWDMAKEQMDEADRRNAAKKQALERQIIHLAARNSELIMALEAIAKKKKLDAVAASSMKAIAIHALKTAGIAVRNAR